MTRTIPISWDDDDLTFENLHKPFEFDGKDVTVEMEVHRAIAHYLS